MDGLTQAAQAGNIETLYQLIAADCNLLEQIDEIPFYNTPLHVAAAAGRTHFAIEIMNLKPSFGRKLNSMGLSPLDLALQNDQTETVRRLVEIDSELIKVKGKGLLTPLHYVAKIGNADLLAEFLIACPLGINDRTVRNETAAHVAAANGHVRALKVLIGWLDRTNNKETLHCKDENGNTLLHIVASNHQYYAANLLDVLELLRKKIANSETNSDGYKALDIILQSPYSDEQKKAAKRILRGQGTYLSIHNFAEFLSSPLMILERVARFDMNVTMGVPMEVVNALLVVATLVVTATYQAVLQPISNENLKDTVIESIPDTAAPSTSQEVILLRVVTIFYEIFLAFNTLTFALSVGMITLLLQLTLGSMVHFSLLLLYINYISLLRLRNAYFVTQWLSFVTFSLNYFVLFGRIFLSSHGNRRFQFRVGHLQRITSRLQMQNRTIRSIHSSQRRVHKE